MDKIIEEKETGTYKMQVDLVECIYHKFRLEIESNPLVRKEDERTKELNAKFTTQTFLEKNQVDLECSSSFNDKEELNKKQSQIEILDWLVEEIKKMDK